MPAHRLGLVASQSGFRKRIVRIDNRVAVLTAGRPLTRSAADQAPIYALPPVPAHAAFVYVQLGAGDYLFVPADVLPARGTTFVDTPASKYQRFRRTFAAIDGGAADERRRSRRGSGAAEDRRGADRRTAARRRGAAGAARRPASPDSL